MLVKNINNEIVITIPNTIELTYVQEIIDYLTVKSIIIKSKATDKQITDIAEEAQEEWWLNNKSKFLE